MWKARNIMSTLQDARRLLIDQHGDEPRRLVHNDDTCPTCLMIRRLEDAAIDMSQLEIAPPKA
jgi:hypothetical protein